MKPWVLIKWYWNKCKILILTVCYVGANDNASSIFDTFSRYCCVSPLYTQLYNINLSCFIYKCSITKIIEKRDKKKIDTLKKNVLDTFFFKKQNII